MKYFILVILMGFFAQARQTDNQVVLKVEGTEITVSAKPGYHLNAEAPATATFDNLEALFKPESKTEKRMVFKTLSTYKSATLKFYVCDDKKTVCEQHIQKLNLKSGEVRATELKSTYDSAKSLNLVSTNGKPTLLVFSAPWCPACVRMVTETYHKPAVAKQLAKLNFVKLNSDIAENYAFSEKFKVKAIPTLVLLDKNGNEAYRWLDFQPSARFAKSVETELKKISQAGELTKNAQLGDATAASVLAHRAFNTLDYAEAVKWFSLTKSERDQKYKLASEVALLQSAADDDEKQIDGYLQGLQKAIVLTTSKLDQLRWTLDFFSAKHSLKNFSDDAKVKARALVAEIDSLAKAPKQAVRAFNESTYGEYGGFEVIELLWMKAKLQGLLDLPEEQKKTNAQGVAEVKKKKLSTDRPGEMLLAIAYLREAGDIALPEQLYKQLISKYPNTYVYFEKYARFSQKNKNYDHALSLVSEALKYPEGNVPQLKLLQSQILKDLNKRDEAAQVVASALNADDIQHKRYEKVYKKLNELKTELASVK